MATEDFAPSFIWNLFSYEGAVTMEEDWDLGSREDGYMVEIPNPKFYGPGNDHFSFDDEEEVYFSMDDLYEFDCVY
jgi:hypothetical protein